jgi:hypothetical protein
MRAYVTAHPGRYAATTGATPTGPEDPLAVALQRTLGSFAAVLRGYRLDPDEEIHALRTLRSMLHGFLSLEVGDGFRYATDVSTSFRWMTELFHQGLRARSSEGGGPEVRAPRQAGARRTQNT